MRNKVIRTEIVFAGTDYSDVKVVKHAAPFPVERVVDPIPLAYHGTQDDQEDEYEQLRTEAMIDGIVSAWSERQAQVICERLGSTKTRKGTRHWKGEGVGTKGINAYTVVDPSRWADQLVASLDSTINQIAKQRAQVLARRLSAQGLIDTLAKEGRLNRNERSTLGRIVGDDTAQELLIESITEPLREMIRSAALRQSQRMADLVTEMDKAGASVEDIRKAVRDQAGYRSAWHKHLAIQVTTASLQGVSMAMSSVVSDHVNLVWTSRHDERVRPAHRRADGQVRKAGNKFHVGKAWLKFPGDPTGPPELTINCYVGNTHVDANNLRFATKRWFSGDVVEIRLSTGNSVTVTPNHPVLRSDGLWVPAYMVVEGNDLLCGTFVGNDVTTPHVNGVPPKIGEVYSSIYESVNPERIRISPPDFHGDGTEGDVYVVPSDRMLGNRVQAATDQQVEQFGFTVAHCATLSHSSLSSATIDPIGGFGGTDGLLTSCNIGATSKIPSFVGSHSGESQVVGLGSVADRQPQVFQPTNDSHPRNTQGSGHFKNGRSLFVQTAQVVKIDSGSFSGHVYNLDTGNGWYTANSIITRNCRCRLVPQVV